ncbi:unnamed protein product [Mycena citricolor]|uniref:Uncharacterized protein n=1 Tax=Mycena citricolor TaxID=2018698 RepID=A0AAD2H067_9AGAR|nr:unnamed protein product [Mycena citricolor]
MYPCGAPDCPKSYKEPGPRTKHRGNCTKYIAYQALLIQERQARAIAAAAAASTSNKTSVPGTLQNEATLSKRTLSPSSTGLSDKRGRKTRVSPSSAPSSVRNPSQSPPQALSPEPDPGPMVGFEDVPPTSGTSSPPSPLSPPLPPDRPASPVQQTNTKEVAGRPTRNRVLPARYRDHNPVPLTAIPRAAPISERRDLVASGLSSSGEISAVPRVRLIVRDTYQTVANVFGLWRSYLHRPTYDPDEHIDAEDLSNRYPSDDHPGGVIRATPDRPKQAGVPLVNRSLQALWGWFNNGSIKKTTEQFNELISVITHKDFEADELVGTSAAQANKEADQEAQKSLPFLTEMKMASVTINVPSGSPDVPSQSFAIPGLQFRSLTSVIKAAFADPISAHFHLSPFKLFHNDTRVYTEIYNSDAFIDKHDKIQRTGELPPDDPDCKLEKVVAAMMQWSDSTHLTNFGVAKLWPIYVLFGNLSKYMRSKPGFGAEHHLAYIPSARDWIHHRGYGIKSAMVENILQATSSIPIENAFIARLGSSFDLHRMLVVDFLHEFELGVWKALFSHLIRLLYAQPGGPSLVSKLDSRFRQIPRFGRDTIRRFATNASEMKKLSARDFEDLLLCSIPVFEGLFPDEEDNKRVMKLLYCMAEWHSFAKLRMHTDSTLAHLEARTTELGRLMRQFQSKTCSKYATTELPREAAARARQEQRQAQAKAESDSTPSLTRKKCARNKKGLNLHTYKWHSLGDYVMFIRLFGPTDNYSTQVGESMHRIVKRFYGLTNKRNHAGQIAVRVTRMARARVSQRVRDAKKMRHFHLVGFDQPDPFTMNDNQAHHATSLVRRYPLFLEDFSFAQTRDPALKNFVPKLQDHLLGRLQERNFDGDTHESFKAQDRQSVQVHGNRLYATKTLRINYTMYDVRREQDIVNPRTAPFVMVRSPETEPDAHPYWYAQVLGVFHTSAFISSSTLVTAPKSFEFLWVRWLGVEPGHRAGFKNARLPKVGFVEESDSLAFGFLDPAYVVQDQEVTLADEKEGDEEEEEEEEEEDESSEEEEDEEDLQNEDNFGADDGKDDYEDTGYADL